jgi:hypothetical protein
MSPEIEMRAVLKHQNHSQCSSCHPDSMLGMVSCTWNVREMWKCFNQCGCADDSSELGILDSCLKAIVDAKYLDDVHCEAQMNQ